MKIKVEDRHIDRGRHADAFGCALSLAISEAVPICEKVAVAGIVRLIGFDDIFGIEIPLPKEAVKFRIQFDQFTRSAGPTGPRPSTIEFELDVPEKFLPKEPVRSKPITQLAQPV